MSEKLCQLDCWGTYTSLVWAWFFFKVRILFKMCWVVEGTLDVGNHWDDERESERGTRAMRLSWVCQESVLPCETDEPRGRPSWDQLGAGERNTRRSSGGPGPLSNGEGFVGKASVWLWVQGVHGNMKRREMRIKILAKESTRTFFHHRPRCSVKTENATRRT